MKQNDVIVIGGGLSGIFAAITAAKRGRQVLLVTKGVGAIAIGGGTIDMLGYDAAGVPVRAANYDVVQRELVPDVVASLRYTAPWGSAQVSAAMHELREACAFFKVLGAYPIDAH